MGKRQLLKIKQIKSLKFPQKHIFSLIGKKLNLMMKPSTIEFLLAVPPLIMMIFSCLGNIYVFLSTQKFKKSVIQVSGSKAKSNDYVIANLIHWVVFVDFFWVIVFASNFIPSAFNLASFSSGLCVFSGMVNEFLSFIGACWHILIAGEFFLLLIPCMNAKCIKKCNKKDDDEINDNDDDELSSSNDIVLQNKSIYNSICFFIIFGSLIQAVLPCALVGSNDNDKYPYRMYYNYYDNNGNQYNEQCWLVGDWVLLWYVPNLIALLLHYIVLIIVIIKYCQTRSYTNAYIYLIKRLLPWIIVYSVIRIIPTMFGMLALLKNQKTVPLWLVMAHHYSLASVGILNAIAWFLTTRVTPNNNKKQRMLTQAEMVESSLQEQD